MSATIPVRKVNEDKMNAFLGKVVGDFGASLSSALVYIGQKLGLYQRFCTKFSLTVRLMPVCSALGNMRLQ